MSMMRKLDDAGVDHNDIIPELIKLQDLMIAPKTRSWVCQKLVSALQDPGEDASLRALCAVLIGSGLGEEARKPLCKALATTADHTACAVIMALMQQPYDPLVDKKRKEDFWHGLFLQWWAGPLTGGKYYSNDKEVPSLSYTLRNHPHSRRLAAFSGNVDYDRISSDGDLRAVLIDHLERASTVYAKVLILRMLDDQGDYEQLALRQFENTGNDPRVRKTAIEEVDIRSPFTEKRAFMRESLRKEGDDLVKATLIALLSRQIHSEAESSSNLEVYKSIMKAGANNPNLAPWLFRGISLLDTNEAVQALDDVLANPDSGEVAQQSCVSALAVYADNSSFVARRYESLVRALNSTHVSVREQAAVVIAQGVPSESTLPKDPVRDGMVREQLQQIAKGTGKVEIRKIIQMYLLRN
jgi:hypothetical protein